MHWLQRFRAAFGICMGAAALSAAAAAAPPAGYPDRPVKLVVPFSAGGQFDIVARLFAKFAGDRLGQTVIVENNAGGGGNIGAAKVAKAPGDGYTLLVFGGNHAIAKALYPQPGFALEDFAPISLISATPHVVLTYANAPFQTMAQMIAYAKQKPGELSYGSPGVGSTMQLAFERIKRHYGLDIVHVPYRGGANALSDLAGGQVQLAVSGIAPAIELIKTGRVRALAVTSATRSTALPDVPTLAESGFPELDAASWLGLVAPRQTPVTIIDRWNALARQFQQDPVVAAQLQAMGFRERQTSPQDFKAYIESEARTYADVVQRTGMTAAQ